MSPSGQPRCFAELGPEVGASLAESLPGTPCLPWVGQRKRLFLRLTSPSQLWCTLRKIMHANPVSRALPSSIHVLIPLLPPLCKSVQHTVITWCGFDRTGTKSSPQTAGSFQYLHLGATQQARVFDLGQRDLGLSPCSALGSCYLTAAVYHLSLPCRLVLKTRRQSHYATWNSCEEGWKVNRICYKYI